VFNILRRAEQQMMAGTAGATFMQPNVSSEQRQPKLAQTPEALANTAPLPKSTYYSLVGFLRLTEGVEAT